MKNNRYISKNTDDIEIRENSNRCISINIDDIGFFKNRL